MSNEIVTERFAEVYRGAEAQAQHARERLDAALAGNDAIGNAQRALASCELVLADIDRMASLATTDHERLWLATDGKRLAHGARNWIAQLRGAFAGVA